MEVGWGQRRKGDVRGAMSGRTSPGTDRRAERIDSYNPGVVGLLFFSFFFLSLVQECLNRPQEENLPVTGDIGQRGQVNSRPTHGK